SGIAGVQMSGGSNLAGHHGASDACVVRPADHAGFEECAIDYQLTASVKQIEQASCSMGSLELAILLPSHPRHHPSLRGQRITRPAELLLLQEKLLPSSLPFLR